LQNRGISNAWGWKIQQAVTDSKLTEFLDLAKIFRGQRADIRVERKSIFEENAPG
jgi:hypothetical protein